MLDKKLRFILGGAFTYKTNVSISRWHYKTGQDDLDHQNLLGIMNIYQVFNDNPSIKAVDRPVVHYAAIAQN